MDTGFSTGAGGGSSGPAMRTGTGSGTGNGVQTQFLIPHGMGVAPSFAFAVATNALAAGDKVTGMDATNIILNFNVAPTAGTLTFRFLAVA